jgi:hypothetical protein
MENGGELTVGVGNESRRGSGWAWTRVTRQAGSGRADGDGAPRLDVHNAWRLWVAAARRDRRTTAPRHTKSSPRQTDQRAEHRRRATQPGNCRARPERISPVRPVNSACNSKSAGADRHRISRQAARCPNVNSSAQRTRMRANRGASPAVKLTRCDDSASFVHVSRTTR